MAYKSKYLGREVDERLERVDALAPKFVTIPVSSCGFNTNLRENQVVDGSQLVDKIIEVASTGAKAVLKAGDFYFNITSQMAHTDSNTGAVIKAFTVDSAYLTEQDIQKVVAGQQPLTANPYDETVMFLYSSTTNKTVSLYTSDLKEKVQEITDVNKNDEVKIASLKAITAYVTQSLITKQDNITITIFGENE